MNKYIAYAFASLFALISIALPFSVMSSENHEKPDAHAHEEGEHGHAHEEPAKKQKKAVKPTDAHAHGEEGADEHAHGETEKGHAHDEKEEGGHAHGEEKGEEHGEEGAGSAVGTDKGILEANEANGFKLSPEALKNFGVKSVPAQPGATVTLPRRAIFFGLKERNLFRLRDGFFKRIDFTTVSKSKTEFTLRVTDVKPGDQIVTDGIGFLRIAELAATGGVADAHSH